MVTLAYVVQNNFQAILFNRSLKIRSRAPYFSIKLLPSVTYYFPDL